MEYVNAGFTAWDHWREHKHYSKGGKDERTFTIGGGIQEIGVFGYHGFCFACMCYDPYARQVASTSGSKTGDVGRNM
jgi:hypothetical protein